MDHAGVGRLAAYLSRTGFLLTGGEWWKPSPQYFHIDDPDAMVDTPPEIPALPYPACVVVGPETVEFPETAVQSLHEYVTGADIHAATWVGDLLTDTFSYRIILIRTTFHETGDEHVLPIVQGIAACERNDMAARYAVAQQTSVVNPTPGQRHAARKAGSPAPLPFRVIKARPRSIRRGDPQPHGGPSGPRAAHQRRAHTRMRVHRKLASPDDAPAGYSAFGPGAPIPANLLGEIVARGHEPPQPGEWLAVKSWSVKSHNVCGELPAVPTVRVVS
jgi:hypothetical protein